MMSKIPVSLKKATTETVDIEILRAGMIAELDAMNMYEQMAANTQNPKIKELLLDITKEEKTHFGEFQAMLLQLDAEQKDELANGEKEVSELNG